MKRHEWEFSYEADKLLAAATAKAKFHTERLEWWAKKRDETKNKIKGEGLEIDESVAFGTENYISNKSMHRESQVKINDSMLRNLKECLTKVNEHQLKVKDYSAWIEVLGSQGSASFPLNQDDWLFFFGK